MQPNQGFLKVLGGDAAVEAAGRSWSEIVSDDDLAGFTAWVEEHLAADTTSCPVRRTKLICADNTLVDVSVTFLPGPSPNPAEWTAIMDTGTPHSLDLLASEVHDSARSHMLIEFSELAVSLLHELGKSITVIQAASEVADSQAEQLTVSRDFRRMISIISLASRELSHQHGIIRSFVRHRRLSVEPVQLGQLVHDSTGLVRGLAEDQQILIEPYTDDTLPPAQIDRGLFQLALISLLNGSLRLVDPSEPMNRRMLVRHLRWQDSGHEVNVEFRLRSDAEELTADQFDTSRRIAELHGGQLVIETPAPQVARCRLLLPV